VRSAGVKLEFKVTQKENSEKILHKLTDYFGCGRSFGYAERV
jgi:hypothetical protein